MYILSDMSPSNEPLKVIITSFNADLTKIWKNDA